MDIKCKKLDCVFNNKASCGAKQISVRQSLHCDSYKHSAKLESDQNQNISKNMFEAAPEFNSNITNTLIRCDANKCMFNKRGNCVSNGVNMQRGSYKAYCSTALKEN